VFAESKETETGQGEEAFRKELILEDILKCDVLVLVGSKKHCP